MGVVAEIQRSGSKMKFAIVLFGAGLAAAAPKAEPEAARLLFPGRSVGLGSSVAVGRTVGVVGRTVAGHVSAPACVRTPVKECVPRTVETPGRSARPWWMCLRIPPLLSV